MPRQPGAGTAALRSSLLLLAGNRSRRLRHPIATTILSKHVATTRSAAPEALRAPSKGDGLTRNCRRAILPQEGPRRGREEPQQRARRLVPYGPPALPAVRADRSR